MNAQVGAWLSHRNWILVALAFPYSSLPGGLSARRNCGSTKKLTSRPRSLRAAIPSQSIPDAWKVGRTKRAVE